MAKEPIRKSKPLSQLDRIELKLDLALELLAIEPHFIQAPHDKRPERQWDRAVALREKAIERAKQIYENSNDSTSK